MKRDEEIGNNKSLSNLLARVRFEGQTWCYSDLRGSSGFSVPPGGAIAFHAVIHGAVRLATTGGTTASLSEGECAFVLKGESHALRTSANSDTIPHDILRSAQPVDTPATSVFGKSGPVSARLLSGRLDVTWPDGLTRSALPDILKIANPSDGNILQPGALAHSGMGSGSAALLTRLTELILVDVLRSNPLCRAAFSPAQHDAIEEALALVSANPAADWTVEMLARSVGMGRSNFAAQFTNSIGQAPMEFVSEKRMQLAATLLRQGKLKIAEIGHMAGYSSEAAFNRRFSRHFGVTPGRMREMTLREQAAATDTPKPYRPLLAGGPASNAIAARKAGIPASKPPESRVSPSKDKREQPPFLVRGKRD